MEKYSAYRDPGTGIQPFLKPVASADSNDVFAKITSPIGYLIGAIRTVLVLAILAVYVILVEGLCLFFKPISPLHRVTTTALTSVLARAALFTLGFLRIRVTIVPRKKGRNTTLGSWKPRSGDIIVSNWVSWIELLWLAFRFNPIFVLPVSESTPTTTDAKSDPIARTPGRRTGTGSANVSLARGPSKRIPIIGFHRISLLSILSRTGQVPPYNLSGKPQSLEEIRKSSPGPVVVFPECTTSNGRGLLRFSDVFKRAVPVKGFQVFIMVVRYDPPTSFSPSLSYSIPSSFLNPLSHVFATASTLVLHTLSIRLLAPADLPSSPTFLVSEIFTELPPDPLSETCATLIAQIGKMKRTGMGWEDKYSLLNLVNEKK